MKNLAPRYSRQSSEAIEINKIYRYIRTMKNFVEHGVIFFLFFFLKDLTYIKDNIENKSI